MTLRKLLPWLPLLIALGSGAIEMRVAIGRLETRVQDIDQRMAHVEERLDRREVLSKADP